MPTLIARSTRLALFGLAVVLPLAAEDPGDACLGHLQDPGRQNINCEIPFEIEGDDLERIRGITAGVIQGASCVVGIHLDRKPLFEALIHGDQLSAPPQPVDCRVATNRDPLDVSFTISPMVRFAGERAVEAEPRIANLQGIPLVGPALMKFVNESTEIRESMVSAVNDFLDPQGEAR